MNLVIFAQSFLIGLLIVAVFHLHRRIRQVEVWSMTQHTKIRDAINRIIIRLDAVNVD